jgi:hypothetical protein
MDAEMRNDEHTKIQLKVQDSRNPSVFVKTSIVDVTCLNRAATQDAVILQKFSVLNEQRQIVLATIPNLRVGSRSGSDPKPSGWNGSYHTKSRTIAIRPVLPPKPGISASQLWLQLRI